MIKNRQPYNLISVSDKTESVLNYFFKRVRQSYIFCKLLLNSDCRLCIKYSRESFTEHFSLARVLRYSSSVEYFLSTSSNSTMCTLDVGSTYAPVAMRKTH